MHTLRIVRPTDNLQALAKMYQAGLGLQVLGSFENHDGFDGIMLGHPQSPYHLEFTAKNGHEAGKAPTPENLLVFYIPDRVEWETACARMMESGFVSVEAFNPYWDRNGRTFEDVDGYRVVLQNSHWNR